MDDTYSTISSQSIIMIRYFLRSQVVQYIFDVGSLFRNSKNTQLLTLPSYLCICMEINGLLNYILVYEITQTPCVYTSVQGFTVDLSRSQKASIYYYYESRRFTSTRKKNGSTRQDGCPSIFTVILSVKQDFFFTFYFHTYRGRFYIGEFLFIWW